MAGLGVRVSLAALLMLLLFGCSTKQPRAADATVTAVDGRGRTFSLPAVPQRIVSLSPGTTEMLFAIGLKGRIVADTTYCDYPPEAKNLPHIGDVNISAEKVIAQRPDLVVASGSANRQAIQTLERLRLNVFVVDPQTFEGTYDALRRLGSVTGQQTEAERVVREMQERVRKAREKVPSNRPSALWIVQMEPVIVAGEKTFSDELIEMAGAKNLGRDAGEGWTSLSPARVVLLQPDVIIAGKETARRVRSRAGWSRVPAVSNNSIVTPPGDQAFRPGPRLADALEQLVVTLHRPDNGRRP